MEPASAYRTIRLKSTSVANAYSIRIVLLCTRLIDVPCNLLNRISHTYKASSPGRIVSTLNSSTLFWHSLIIDQMITVSSYAHRLATHPHSPLKAFHSTTNEMFFKRFFDFFREFLFILSIVLVRYLAAQRKLRCELNGISDVYATEPEHFRPLPYCENENNVEHFVTHRLTGTRHRQHTFTLTHTILTKIVRFLLREFANDVIHRII